MWSEIAVYHDLSLPRFERYFLDKPVRLLAIFLVTELTLLKRNLGHLHGYLFFVDISAKYCDRQKIAILVGPLGEAHHNRLRFAGVLELVSTLDLGKVLMEDDVDNLFLHDDVLAVSRHRRLANPTAVAIVCECLEWKQE